MRRVVEQVVRGEFGVLGRSARARAGFGEGFFSIFPLPYAPLVAVRDVARFRGGEGLPQGVLLLVPPPLPLVVWSRKTLACVSALRVRQVLWKNVFLSQHQFVQPADGEKFFVEKLPLSEAPFAHHPGGVLKKDQIVNFLAEKPADSSNGCGTGC